MEDELAFVLEIFSIIQSETHPHPRASAFFFAADTPAAALSVVIIIHYRNKSAGLSGVRRMQQPGAWSGFRHGFRPRGALPARCRPGFPVYSIVLFAIFFQAEHRPREKSYIYK